jgi:hypothetical protein
MPHLAILVHENQRFTPTGCLLGELSAIWREQGLRVTVLHGPTSGIEADALVLHVNLTEVPQNYLRLLEQYPIVINGRATDISKRRISRNLLRREDDYQGPVIVKTDRNFRGIVESASARQGSLVLRLAEALRNRLPWSLRSTLPEYRIFESLRKVPRGVWYNPDLVVERFLPERRTEGYCVRTWLFLGNQERIALFHSKHPIIKSHNIIRREPLTDVPQDLREMRRELGFDFGKFDFAVVEGRTVLYDANRTPTLGSTPRQQCLPWMRLLAEGIWTFMPKPPQ